MKVIFLQRSKHIVQPEIKYFPAIYVDGQVVCFADLRITFPRRTVHIIFNNAGRKEKKEMIDDWENEIQVNVVGNIFDNPEIREAQK